MPPLTARVPAPRTLETPTVPVGVSWRAATLDDVDEVTRVYGEIAAVEHPDWAETREGVEDEFSHSWVDLARDTLLAEVDGRAVAFGQVIAPPNPETIVRTILFGGVVPDFRGRGIGRELMRWQHGRALQKLAESERELPGWVVAYAEERSASTHRMFERAGLRLTRYFVKLERDLAEPIPDVALPDGLRLVRPTLDDAARFLEAKNDAFRDHWGSQPTSEEQWAAILRQSTTRLDLSFLALDGERVAGFVLTDVNPDDFERQGFVGGYVGLVGVVREWRRRGVAPALLATALRAYRDAGHERVTLDVDTENPSGALGLYTRLGFAPKDRSLAFVQEF
jgi:mycothiol synthase